VLMLCIAGCKGFVGGLGVPGNGGRKPAMLRGRR